MRIEVEENPNCGGTDEFQYRELGEVRPIKAIRALESAITASADPSFGERGKTVVLEVVGVAKDGAWEDARCVKVADSGAGFAFLIFGGSWGLRLKPEWHKASWDLSDPKQWGEPFKIYGSEEDIIYG